MAPDLILCKEESIEQEATSRDVKEIMADAAAAAAEASTTEAMMYCNPWSSERNSPRNGGGGAAAASSIEERNPNNLNNNSSNGSSTVVPIITLKTREALRNFSCRDHDEEIWQLKRALLEKDMELRRRKVHAANVEAENRKLAKEIAEGNTNGRTTPSLGSPRKLHAKLTGMKVMLEEAYNTCELQSVELYHLRQDVCLTHARELEVERNVYAVEVGRLQEVVKKLKLANGRIGHESRMISRLKAKNHHLEVMNLRLSSCLSASLSQAPRTPRTRRTPQQPQLQPQRDALVRNSFGSFEYIQQQQENAFSNRLSMSPGACLPR